MAIIKPGGLKALKDVHVVRWFGRDLILSRTILSAYVWGLCSMFWVEEPWQQALCLTFCAQVIMFRVATTQRLSKR